MEKLYRFNDFLNENYENRIIEDKIIDSNAEIKLITPLNYDELYFDIDGVGKMVLGNYEWFGDGVSFAKEHKTIQGMIYWWKDLNDISLNGKYKISNKLSNYILTKLKND